MAKLQLTDEITLRISQKWNQGLIVGSGMVIVLKSVLFLINYIMNDTNERLSRVKWRRHCAGSNNHFPSFCLSIQRNDLNSKIVEQVFAQFYKFMVIHLTSSRSCCVSLSTHPLVYFVFNVKMWLTKLPLIEKCQLLISLHTFSGEHFLHQYPGFLNLKEKHGIF